MIMRLEIHYYRNNPEFSAVQHRKQAGFERFSDSTKNNHATSPARVGGELVKIFDKFTVNAAPARVRAEQECAIAHSPPPAAPARVWAEPETQARY